MTSLRRFIEQIQSGKPVSQPELVAYLTRLEQIESAREAERDRAIKDFFFGLRETFTKESGPI